MKGRDIVKRVKNIFRGNAMSEPGPLEVKKYNIGYKVTEVYTNMHWVWEEFEKSKK